MKNSKQFFRLVEYKEGSIQSSFELKQDKVIIGSSKSSDFIISEDTVSHYHAMITISNDLIEIHDLSSLNGISINGEKKNSSIILPNDNVQIGHHVYILEETSSFETLIELDKNISQLVEQEEIFMPPLPPKESLVVIDNEYCDIDFSRNNFSPVTYSELFNSKEYDFIDFDERDEKDGIIHSEEKKSLEVITCSMGIIINIDYLDINKKNHYISGAQSGRDTAFCPGLLGNSKHPISKREGKEISFLEIDNFEYTEIEDGRMYQSGVTQIFVTKSQKPPRLSIGSLIEKDPLAHKQMASIFGGLVTLMLILLLVDIPTPTPPRPKRTIVFSVKAKTQVTKNAPTVSTVDKKEGVQKENINKKQAKLKKSITKKKTAKKLAKVSKKTKKVTTRKVKRVAKKLPRFKLKQKLSSTISKSVSRAKNMNNTKSFNASSSLSKNLFKNSGSKSVAVRDIASFSKGNKITSAGLKGLATKKGVASAYSAPKTVVMGSIDPDLLRKILREYLPQFHYCYQNELNDKQDLMKGSVDMNFRINKNGKVSKVKIKSQGSKFSRKGVNCMAKVLHMIDFPRPKGGGVVDVRQPLNFQSERKRI